MLLRPRDAWLALHIGASIALTPRWIARVDLRDPRSLRRSMAHLPLPRADRGRIAWFRGWWLERPFFRRFDTCYVRAVILYRFLRCKDEDVGLHFGIETRENVQSRLRGHAWVTHRGTVIEAPPPVSDGRIREIALWRAPSQH
jgi:hypothetical protein